MSAEFKQPISLLRCYLKTRELLLKLCNRRQELAYSSLYIYTHHVVDVHIELGFRKVKQVRHVTALNHQLGTTLRG